MISIKNSETFKKDYANYQKSIIEIQDESIKKECLKLLLQLADEVTIIDMHHTDILISGRISETVKDARSRLASIRKNLESKIKNYQSNKNLYQA